MKEAVIIFPNQLFKNHPCLDKKRKVFLIEEKRYFTDFKFHKKKLVLHRASMKAYRDFLKKKGYKVDYVEFSKQWKSKVKKHVLFAVRPYDYKLESRLPKMTLVESPAFFGGELKKKKSYLMANFYRKQRKQLDILMKNSRPKGGKWSFDEENRETLPDDIKIPKIKGFSSKYVREAAKYVNKHFQKNPGSTDGFVYPVNFSDAEKWLKQFIKNRFKLFGNYEDAIAKDEPFLFHSVISPLLNTGLLTPDYVVKKALAAKVPLNSKEGFIRQIIGWREFILQVYLLEGKKHKRSNYFRHRKKLPYSFYSATTGMLPVDNVIKKVLKNAYAHHIERLMILGNYMLLKGYHPDEVYKWFMEMFIDAYDWVMVPNVYGMSQYADGGLMATKPYISSSNYVRRMSDFPRGDWCEKWDKLFWDFIKKHKKKFKNNPRMALILSHLKK